ncbi:glycosyltransferase family 2 protein [Ornithinicoccus halotolerans]|uniref:glycosyltransferase family 2 protein n=1 Tax=Ornithinicoccus halotolerans TaxID=1748220 RepID=UPI00129821DF|nr:glycosyltransferase family A protein [Ornithinicoccus halotolerans]
MTAPASRVTPSVTVIIPTHNRPEQVRQAIEAARGQHYRGAVRVLVVYDRADPEEALRRDGDRPVTVVSNSRSPGLAGARNTGILAADTELVAFCDDDDYWEATKLERQVAALQQEPEAPLASSSIIVEYEGRSSPRYAGTDRVTHAMLVRSRMSMLHSSTLLFRRDRLLGDLGLIDEDVPGSQNEDWDILLRAASLHPVVHVDQPLVHVRWGRASYFSRRWDTKIDSSLWMLERHPDVAANPQAAARLLGQVAFAHACSGDRRDAWQYAGQVLRRDPRQWRWLVASLVALWPPSGEHVLGALHRLGRGV